MFGNRVKVILTENFYVLSVLPFPLTTDNNAKSLGVIQTVRVNAMQQKMPRPLNRVILHHSHPNGRINEYVYFIVSINHIG